MKNPVTRETLLEHLNAYREAWCRSEFDGEKQSEWIAETRGLLMTNPDCFHRSSMEGHVTGSGVVVSDDFSEVLLTHHHVLNRWLQLGGHVDGSSDIPEAALREVQEEAGIASPEFFSYEERLGIASSAPLFYDIDIHRIPDSPKEKSHLHYDFRYLIVVPRATPIAISEESNDLRWFSWDDAYREANTPSLHRLFDKARWLSKQS
jgi:8-oxo-dGTP pyrophosphatase MutT (NUDIX family)